MLLKLMLMITAAITIYPGDVGAPPGEFDNYNIAVFMNKAILSLHGLWPNYSEQWKEDHDTEKSWPEYCGKYEVCSQAENNDNSRKTCNFQVYDSICNSEGSKEACEKWIKPSFNPTYCTGVSRPLAEHEWPKHGSCTNLTFNDFYEETAAAYQKFRDIIYYEFNSAASEVDYSELEAMFSPAAELNCKSCHLSELIRCHNTTSDHRVDGVVSCGYGGSCSHCATVAIM